MLCSPDTSPASKHAQCSLRNDRGCKRLLQLRHTCGGAWRERPVERLLVGVAGDVVQPERCVAGKARRLIKKSWRLRSVEVSGGDLSAPVTFEHGHVLSPDNPSVVLRSNAAAETSVTAAQPQRSKSGLNKKASTRVKGAVFSKEVAFGPEMQRVLPSGNEAPVCFIINVQSNTLIVGQFLVVNLTSSTFYSFVQDMKMAPSLTAVFPTWSTKFSLCLLSAVDSRQLPPLTRILLPSVRAMILRLPLLFVGALRIHTWATALCQCAFPL
jgi:hypothetical protein